MIKWFKSKLPLFVSLGKKLKSEYDKLSKEQKDELKEKLIDFVTKYVIKHED